MVSNFQKQHEVRSLNRNDEGVCGSKSHAKKTQDLSDSSSVQSIASEYYARITIWSGSGDWADMFNGQKGRCIHHQIRRYVSIAYVIHPNFDLHQQWPISSMKPPRSNSYFIVVLFVSYSLHRKSWQLSWSRNKFRLESTHPFINSRACVGISEYQGSVPPTPCSKQIGFADA